MRNIFLNKRQNRQHSDHNAGNQSERNEELVQSASCSRLYGVKDVAKYDAGDGYHVQEDGGAHQGAEPSFALGFVHLGFPALAPRVRKVDDEDELDQDEDERPHHTKDTPHSFESSKGDEESSDDDSDEDQDFEEPKSILDSRSGIFAAFHTQHDDSEQREETRHAEADTVDCLVTDHQGANFLVRSLIREIEKCSKESDH